MQQSVYSFSRYTKSPIAGDIFSLLHFSHRNQPFVRSQRALAHLTCHRRRAQFHRLETVVQNSSKQEEGTQDSVGFRRKEKQEMSYFFSRNK